ncbi:PAS domain-containing protein [Oceaniglobus ichthyenteri]|uniref:PAS domain-containing protein n=1 Tax=Oceaniglobus ichthyenteri TaxID=2136177 RepID=UPI000D36A461|nr:PAS domain-containing protein [Oceaniglobus ichthyenteri]
MVYDSVILAALAILSASVVSLGALWAVSVWQRDSMSGDSSKSHREPAVCFVFEGTEMVDLSEAAQTLISVAGDHIKDFNGLSSLLAKRFPTLRTQYKDLGTFDQRNIISTDNSEIATLSRRNAQVRLCLNDIENPDDRVIVDRSTIMSFESELNSLRDTTEHMPFLVWRQDDQGNITWANRAYLDACATFGNADRAGLWPPCQLFDINIQQNLNSDSTKPHRHRLGGGESGAEHWYQFHITPLDDDFLISAMDVNTVVEAESSMRTFVQTLSKTFADLPIGLAVFTRDRRLALFNPALADLTTIAPQNLITRPTIFAFFDMLRERQMMPEPKNYNSWREQIADLEASAVDGTYLETWHLPYGRTYRVTGRPQMDGAVALLFEDISDEIGINRRYRTELEVGQSVIDSLTQGMAVFSPTGVMTLTNAAYDTLWGTNTREGLDTLYIGDAVRHWSEKCAPNPVWEKLRTYVMSDVRAGCFDCDAILLDGRPLLLEGRSLPGGSTLVQFNGIAPAAHSDPVIRAHEPPRRING